MLRGRGVKGGTTIENSGCSLSWRIKSVLACCNCLYLPKACKCLQSQPWAGAPPQQGRAMGRWRLAPWWPLEQRLVAPRHLLLLSVCMCLAQTKGNIHCWPWWYHRPLDFKFSVVRLNKYYKNRTGFLQVSLNTDLAFQYEIIFLPGACFHDSLFAATLCYTFGIQAINL